jgi:hypothetical protein
LSHWAVDERGTIVKAKKRQKKVRKKSHNQEDLSEKPIKMLAKVTTLKYSSSYLTLKNAGLTICRH